MTDKLPARPPGGGGRAPHHRQPGAPRRARPRDPRCPRRSPAHPRRALPRAPWHGRGLLRRLRHRQPAGPVVRGERRAARGPSLPRRPRGSRGLRVPGAGRRQRARDRRRARAGGHLRHPARGAGIKLGMPPAKLGLIYSHTGLRKFIDLCGPANTAELFYVGRNVDAERAERMGLVNEVVEPDELDERVLDLAAEIAANAPLSLAGNKRALRALRSQPLPEEVERELIELRESCFRSEDFREGVAPSPRSAARSGAGAERAARETAPSGAGPTVAANRAAPHLPRRGAQARRDRGSRRARRADRARLARSSRALRRLHRHVLARQRQVGRLRRGLRLLLAVALRGGRHADARDDEPRADPRARPRRRGGRRAPLLHGHPGPGPVQARLRQHHRGSAPRLPAHQPQALRLDRAHVGRARPGPQGGGGAAGPPQRRDRRELLPGGLVHRSLRRAAAHHRRRPGRRPRDLRGRHPQPRRVQRAAGGDGLRAGRGESHLGAHQPAQPAPRHEVRRSRADGSVGGGQVGGDLPADPARGAVPPVRGPQREPRCGRHPAAGRQGRAQRRDDGQLPHHPRLGARAGPADVRGAGAERRPPGRQRRQPPARQPLGLARGREPAHAGRRARRLTGRGQLLGSLHAAAPPPQGVGAAAARRGSQHLPRDRPRRGTRAA